MRSLLNGRVVVLLAFQVLILTSGCGTTRMYEGPQHPHEEVAVIQGAWNLFVNRTSIWRVDDQAVGAFDRAAEVRPGKHTVRVIHHVSQGYIQGDLELDMKAGHIYEADGTERGFILRESWLWVVDLADGSIVAGKRPPD